MTEVCDIDKKRYPAKIRQTGHVFVDEPDLTR